MKRYSAFLLIIALAIRLSAQLPSGAVAPDFTANDIDGQSWHLHQLLEEGKIVILEVSATWCPPCWAYHNSHAMQELYEAHGPQGDDKLRVLFVEGDPATNVNCLYGQSGCNDFTPGNWVNGTTYPYLDNAAIADSFQVAYFPTIFVICPNKKTYQVGQLNAEALWEKASGCPVAYGTNNACIYGYNAGTGLREICENLHVKPSFSLVNLGSSPLESATITLQWNNNTVQTQQWYGNLPVYGEALVAFDSMLLDSPGTLKTTITSVNNGAGDEDFSNNVRNDNFTNAAEFNTQQVILKIRTDDYGAETYWELRDDQDNILYHGGNANVGPDGGGSYGNALSGPGAYGNNMVINKTLMLPGDGCYSLLMVDAYGDGMCCGYGNGYYKLYNGNNPAMPVLTGGEFGATEQRGFQVQSTTGAFAPDMESFGLRIFPNPASDRLHIEFSLSEPSFITTTVVNTMGQTIYTADLQLFMPGEHVLDLPANDWPESAYFVRFQAGSDTVMKKFWVK